MKAPVASHPLPCGEGNYFKRVRARPATFPTFSEGRRWTATGVLTSRRGSDFGSDRIGPSDSSNRSRMRGHFRHFDHQSPATHNRGLAVYRQVERAIRRGKEGIPGAAAERAPYLRFTSPSFSPKSSIYRRRFEPGRNRRADFIPRQPAVYRQSARMEGCLTITKP